MAFAKVWNGSAWVGSSEVALSTFTIQASDVNVTANSTAHTNGSWVQLVSSTASAVGMLSVAAQVGVSATDTASILTIGIGGSGSDTPLFSYACGGHSVTGGGVAFQVPVYIPAGTRISARLQSVVTGGKVATVLLATAPVAGGARPAATVDTLNVNTANSGATNCAAANTYAQAVSSTSKAYRAIVVVPSMRATNVASALRGFSVGAGGSGLETTLGTVWSANTTAELFGLDNRRTWPPIVVGHVPAGTRLAVACSNVTATAGAFDATLLGIPYS